MSITIDGVTTHTGLVVSKLESTFDCGYDSNYYAIVWNWNTLSTDSILYNTTYPHGGTKGTCQIDASPDVQAAYKTYQDIKEFNHQILKLQDDTNVPKKDSLCIVYRGRLAPQGLICTVKHIYETNYGPKCIIVGRDGVEYKTYIRNLDVLQVPILKRYVKPQYDTNMIKMYQSDLSKLINKRAY